MARFLERQRPMGVTAASRVQAVLGIAVGWPPAAGRRNTAADLGMPAYRDIAGRLTAGPAKP
jgi:hypothetical protein